MHFYSTLFSSWAEIYETTRNCVKLEIFTEPFGWVTGGGSFLKPSFKSSGNAYTPERRQFVERRPNLLNILRASSRHQHNRLPSSGRLIYPYPASESCFQILYIIAHSCCLAASSSTAAEQIFNFSIIKTHYNLSCRRSMPHQPIMIFVYTA
jgi:hypothetical protein